MVGLIRTDADLSATGKGNKFMYKIPKDREIFEKIMKMKDSNRKYLKLSDYMLNVIPCSYYWEKARTESERLDDLGYVFTEEQLKGAL